MDAVAKVAPKINISLVSEDSFIVDLYGEKFKFKMDLDCLTDKLKMTPSEFVDHCKVLASREGANVLDFINEQGFKLIGGSRKKFNSVCDRVFNERFEGRWLSDGYKIVGNLLTVLSDRMYNKNYTVTVRWDQPIKNLPSKNTKLMKIDKVANLKRGTVLSRYEVRDLMDSVKSIPDGQWNLARILWKSKKEKIVDSGEDSFVEDMWERDGMLWVKADEYYVFPLEDISADSLIEILSSCSNEIEFNEMLNKYQGRKVVFDAL